MNDCNHTNVICLNQYELIRKYKCDDCGEIMMCSCDQEHGEKYLSHQLNVGCWLEAQKRVPVTIGFQNKICPECRGDKAIPAPVASMSGRTTKILRYYWREIAFKTTQLFYERHPEFDPKNPEYNEFFHPRERKIIEKEVIEEIKELHKKHLNIFIKKHRKMK